MAPVINKTQSMSSTMSSSVEEAKFMYPKNIVSPVSSSPRSDIEFAECATDHVAKISVPDEDIHCELDRPTRAYSIGSRSEHNRMFKQHTGGGGFAGGGGGGGGGSGGNNLNDSDHCNIRVRAFSVGSRAKIPRCDLQRHMLAPKVLLEQLKHNSHSNNNINLDNTQLTGGYSASAAAAAAYNQWRRIYGNRDKKSTSAPLLIHKSQHLDRLSDLMEIDFSIKHGSNSTNSRINLAASNSTLGSTSSTVSANSNAKSVKMNANSNTTTTTTSATTLLTNSQSSQQLQKKFTTDNGYLEMKPVGDNYTNIITSSTATTPIISTTSTVKTNKYLNKKPITAPKTITTNQGGGIKSSDVKYNANNLETANQNIIITNTTTTTTSSPLSSSSCTTPITIATTNATTVLPNNFKIAQLEQNHNNLNNKINELQQQHPQQNYQHQQQTIHNKLYKKLSIPTTGQLLPQPITPDNFKNDNEQQQSKINQNIVEDYINIERKFDAYMTLNANNNTPPTPTTTTTTNITNATTQLLLHDNDKQTLLTHSLSHDEQQNNKNLKMLDNDNSGYEILHIKSDSSLQSHHKHHIQNRPISTIVVANNNKKSDNNNKNIEMTTTIRPRSTNSTILLPITNSTLTTTNSSSTTCLISTTAPTTTTSSSTTTTIANNVITSRPPSVNLEHELYYASLDWPQCSKELLLKSKEANNVLCVGNDTLAITTAITPTPIPTSATITTITPNVHNVYAKIDFDHSDSSSSSSKNI